MREMQKVLYIGGFEMPDKNAAAQRVLSVAKIFRLLGDEVVFYGITKGDDFEGEVDGFRYEAREYPRSTAMWETYLFGYGILRYIKKINPSYIVLYNYPAIAQNRIIRYGRKHNIKVIGDITEWYNPHNPVKRFDTLLRMKWSNKRLDGIIAISKYLEKYYSRQKVLLLPPLIDKEEEKWTVTSKGSNENSIILVYAGTPGMKDRLDFIVKGLGEFDVGKFFLHIVGLTKEQFENNLSYELLKYDINSTLWFEDESLLIGRRAIPKSLFNKMREAQKIIYLDIPKECRAEYIVNTYGKYNIDDLKESILKIKKRLGGERLKESLELLDNGNIYECVLNMLYYYDKAYKLSINENKLVSIKCEDNNFDNIVESIIKAI